jgi:acetylglutamate kinase
MKPSKVVIKLGGASLQDESVLKTFTAALKEYRQYGYQIIVVHGGGPAINRELTKRNIQWNFHSGQRVTTPEMIGAIEDVLHGQVNSQLVTHLKDSGIPALGISGAQNNTLFCTQASDELGLVGNIEDVNITEIEKALLDHIPVISTIGVGKQGEKYNINADWAASRIAQALKAQYLIFLTDQKGILNEGMQLIPELGISGLHTLIEEEIVKGGMLTKTKTILSALESGVKAVRVMNGLDCVKGLWSNHIGTWCLSETNPAPSFQEQMDLGLTELRYVFN